MSPPNLGAWPCEFLSNLIYAPVCTITASWSDSLCSLSLFIIFIPKPNTPKVDDRVALNSKHFNDVLKSVFGL